MVQDLGETNANTHKLQLMEDFWDKMGHGDRYTIILNL